jgi:acyl-CoA thioesterase
MATAERLTACRSLEVTALGGDEFVDVSPWQGESRFRMRGAYGGQVLGQALMAACRTVADPDLLLLSAHCYVVCALL